MQILYVIDGAEIKSAVGVVGKPVAKHAVETYIGYIHAVVSGELSHNHENLNEYIHQAYFELVDSRKIQQVKDDNPVNTNWYRDFTRLIEVMNRHIGRGVLQFLSLGIPVMAVSVDYLGVIRKKGDILLKIDVKLKNTITHGE